MHGDLTRDSFDPRRHYSSVRYQQGRVQLDADFNEQADIGLHLARATTADVIGPTGAPYADPTAAAHFKIEGASPETLTVAPGHFYVDGILVENDGDQPVPLNAQPDLPAGAPIVSLAGGGLVSLADAPTGQYGAVLEVARRHITAIQEPSLREVALGPHAPDTTTRERTAWQVYLYQTPGGLNCVSAQDHLPRPSRGRLTSSLLPPAPATDPCQPGGAGGYQGLENQLYRVEIHTGGALNTATFKWSRENGSVVVAVDDFVEEPAGLYTRVLVSSLGRDEVLGLAEAQWVELVDDQTVQLGQPGTLAQIVDIKSAVGGGYVVALSQSVAGHRPPGSDPTLWHPYLRRWDQTDDLEGDGSVLVEAGPLGLECGVQVEFSVEATGGGPEFRTGDYWIFAARASTGQVEILAAAPPRGARHCALLALVDWDDAAETLTVHDCRPLFPATTDLINLLYVGGDGQEGPENVELLSPLQVSVTRGRYPVPGAHVHFTVTLGSGTIAVATPAPGAACTAIDCAAVTDAEGVASCTWTPGGENVQRVEARLLLPDNTDAPNPPVRFSATPTIGVAADPGVHIKAILWNDADGAPGVPAVNDHTVPMERFLAGLTAVCDQSIEPTSIRRPTCFVTLELPFPLSHPIWGPGVTAFQPVILDAQLAVEQGMIRWRPNPQTQQWLASVVQDMMRQLETRLLVHLTLKGNFIWQLDRPDIFLDGEALGTPEGAEPHNLRLPHGDGRSGGDFEMWFWLEPDQAPPPPVHGLVWDMFGIDRFTVLDPIRALDSYDKTVMDLLYAGLVRLNDKLEVVPDLADSWDFTDNGTRAIFNLRHDLAFSDGTPLTAEDVRFSLERAMDSNNGWAGPVYLWPIKSIDVIDDTTLEMNAAHETFPRFFLAQLTTPPAKIVSRAAVEGNPEAWDDQPVTSGAFAVTQWERNSDKLVLDRNPHHWQPAAIDQIVLRRIPDHNAALARFHGGESQVLSSLQAEGLGDLGHDIPPSFGLRYVGFHHGGGSMLSDPRVRLALAFALNRDEVAEIVLQAPVGGAIRLAPPGLVEQFGFGCDLAAPGFDLAKAEQLLAEAGFVRDHEGWINAATGERLAFDLSYAAEGNNDRLVDVIARGWDQFGVKVNPTRLDDLAQFSVRLHTIQRDPAVVEAYCSAWVADYADPQNVLSQQFHSLQEDRHENNTGPYSNDEFDQLVDRADFSGDAVEIRDLYCQAEAIALQEVAWLPLFNPQPRALIREGVQGFVLTGQGLVIPDFGALGAP